MGVSFLIAHLHMFIWQSPSLLVSEPEHDSSGFYKHFLGDCSKLSHKRTQE